MDVVVAHALEGVCGEGGAVAAAAVEDELGVLVGEVGFDVAFDDAFGEVLRSGGVARFPFVVLADIYEAGGVCGGETLQGLCDGDFVDAAFGFVNEFQESFGVFHV